MVADLRAADVEFLFVLFRHAGSIDFPGSTGWRRQICEQLFDELGAPWVDVGVAFAVERDLAGRATLDYFLPPEHAGSGHYNALGDALSFEVLREGLRAHLGLGRGGNLLLAQDVRSEAGRAASASWREIDPELAALGQRPPWLELDLDAEGRGGLHWELRGAATSLRARVHLLSGAAGPCTLRLRARSDGADMGDWTLATGAPLELELDLRDARRLSLGAAELLGDPAARVVLSEVALEFAGRIAPPQR